MGRADDYDLASRQRIARHIQARYSRMKEGREDYGHQEFADALHVSRPTVTNILNGNTKGIGLDLFIKAWKNLRLDPLLMLDQEPGPGPILGPSTASGGMPRSTETKQAAARK